MTVLVLGMAIFFGAHLFPRVQAARMRAIQSLGAHPYRVAFALVSFVGLLLIVIGYRGAPYQELYAPLGGNRAIAHALMPFAFVLMIGAYAPSNLKRYVRHPMGWATVLWAISHLTANGDVASVLLFGGFGVYAVAHMALVSAATPGAQPPLQPRIRDLILIAAGLAAYSVAMWAHGALFGVWVVG